MSFIISPTREKAFNLEIGVPNIRLYGMPLSHPLNEQYAKLDFKDGKYVVDSENTYVIDSVEVKNEFGDLTKTHKVLTLRNKDPKKPIMMNNVTTIFVKVP